jgi:Flp pilus assembly protein CpaB
MIKNLAIGGSNRTLLILALLMGLVCAVLVGVYLSGLESGSGGGTGGNTLPVVVASREIPPLTTITEDMLTVQEVPAELVLLGAFTEPSEVVGKKAQIQIVTGAQLLTSNAIDAEVAKETFGANAPLSLLIPEGKRAFAIYTSQVAAAGGLVRAGDNVDLMLSTEGDGGNGTCYLLQDIQVLAVGATTKKPTSEGDAGGIAAAAADPEAKTYTLAVSDQQAVQLATAQRSVSDASVGKQVWVVLRPFGDHNVSGGPTCNLGS